MWEFDLFSELHERLGLKMAPIKVEVEYDEALGLWVATRASESGTLVGPGYGLTQDQAIADLY